MKKLYAIAALSCAAFATPASAATLFSFDAANSYVNVTSNPTSCFLLGSCPLTSSLVTPLSSFSLDVGQSQTFDFAQFVVGPGLGIGSAVISAQLAFLTPNSAPASSGAAASYFRIGGLFTPGILGGSLTWDNPTQQLVAADGTKFTVSFGSVAGAQFGGTTRAPVTVTLDSVAAIPEPATWAMMLLGFGLIGYSLRARKPRVTVLQVA